MADDNAPESPRDPRVQELEIAKKRAEVRKLSAEARSAEIDSLVPELPSELPSGKLDVPEKASPIGVLASYRALDTIASNIVDALPTGMQRVWIVPDDSLERYRSTHQVVLSQLTRAKASLKAGSELLDASRPPQGATLEALGAAAAISVAASALPTVMSLFRTNTTIRNEETTVPFMAVAAAVAQRILSIEGRDIPHVTMSLISPPMAQELLDLAGKIENDRDDLRRRVVEYRATYLDEQNPALAAHTERIAALKKLLDGDGTTEQRADNIVKAISEAASNIASERMNRATSASSAKIIDEIIEFVDALLTQLRSVNSTGSTMLGEAAVYGANANSHILLLQSPYAGSESVYEEVSMKRDRGLHMGVIMVSYVPMCLLMAAATSYSAEWSPLTVLQQRRLADLRSSGSSTSTRLRPLAMAGTSVRALYGAYRSTGDGWQHRREPVGDALRGVGPVPTGVVARKVQREQR